MSPSTTPSPDGAEAVPVLTYHALVERPQDLDAWDPGSRLYVFTIDEFDRHMNHLVAEGFATIAMADVVRWLDGETELPERPVVVSFDDGHVSNAELAVPALTQRSQKAIFFVTAGRVGRPDERFLTWAQLEMMLAGGMEIGSHTLTHPFPSAISPAELEYELEESKGILEHRLDAPVDFVASPSGYDSRHFARLAEKVGYRAALQGRILPITRSTHRFALGRFVLKRSHGFDLFRRLVEPGSRAHVPLRRRQMVRNAARRVLGPRGYETLRARLLGGKRGDPTWP